MTCKVLTFGAAIYLVSNLMPHYSTYIYRVVYTYNNRQNIDAFCLKIRHFDIQVYFGKYIY